MKAVCWYGKKDIRVENVPDPKIINNRDAIIKVTATALCDNSNPNEELSRKETGNIASGLFGYSHMRGGFSGGQAEYVRVPFSDVGPIKIPKGIPDEKVLFLSDIFPTGYMAAENANIQKGDTVAIWGCGPVGQFTIHLI